MNIRSIWNQKKSTSKPKPTFTVWGRIGCNIELDFELFKEDPERALAEAIQQGRFTPVYESRIEEEVLEQLYLETDDFERPEDDVVAFILDPKSLEE